MGRFPALLAAALASLLLLLWAAPAGAHSETGEMTVIVAEQTGPSTVRLEVGITFTNDGHLAEEATVSATFAGSGGPSLTAPVTLGHISGGRYGTEVELASGTWEANIASIDPEASATTTVVVSPDFGTTTTTSPSSTTTTAAPVVETDSSDSGTSWAVPVIVVAVALAVGAAIGVLLAFRKRPPST